MSYAGKYGTTPPFQGIMRTGVRMSEVGQRDWDVECSACRLMVGQIVDGRFVHDEECSLLPRIGMGVLRCCACGGKLVGRAHAVEESPMPELAPVMSFERRRAANQGRG